jgi:hypothetical protein
MIDDTFLQALPEDPELGFIALVNNLDEWFEKASSNDRDGARKMYGEALHAFVAERKLHAELPRLKDYDSDHRWWDDFVLGVANFKAKCIFRQNGGEIPLPNPDLPDQIRDDYQEARSIVSRSPRGSAALLRLAIQKACFAKNLASPARTSMKTSHLLCGKVSQRVSNRPLILSA